MKVYSDASSFHEGRGAATWAVAGQYFEDKAWPIIAIIGLVVTLVDLGRMGLEGLRKKAAERAARRKAEAAALASQAQEAKLAETVVETMWAIEEFNVKRVLKYILTKPNRRFTAWSTNVFMEDLVAKRIVRRSHVEDGISSKGTYLVHPAIWAVKDQFLEANAKIQLGDHDYTAYGNT